MTKSEMIEKSKRILSDINQLNQELLNKKIIKEYDEDIAYNIEEYLNQ